MLAGEGTVACEIHDTGEGLPPEVGTRPTAPFFSTKGAFARDPAHAAQEATGLGLAVSRHLLALHGGRLELRSVPSGTTAAIILPRAEPSETPAAAAEAFRATGGGAGRAARQAGVVQGAGATVAACGSEAGGRTVGAVFTCSATARYKLAATPSSGVLIRAARRHFRGFGAVTIGKSSVRNGDAGRPSLFHRLTTG